MIEVTSIGNAGFHIASPAAHLYIDAFYRGLAGVAARPAVRATAVKKADIILVTHAHFDHFLAGETAMVAMRTGARVVGPAQVIAGLRKRLPSEALIELEPARRTRRQTADSVRTQLGPVSVTAFRTFHGRDHNSYLVEMPGFRFLHDGDNEDTRMLPLDALGRLDAILLGPWQGSGWVEFVEKSGAARYLLMHLTLSELDDHAAGRFLPGLCDHVPAGLIALRPGESWKPQAPA